MKYRLYKARRGIEIDALPILAGSLTLFYFRKWGPVVNRCRAADRKLRSVPERVNIFVR